MLLIYPIYPSVWKPLWPSRKYQITPVWHDIDIWWYLQYTHCCIGFFLKTQSVGCAHGRHLVGSNGSVTVLRVGGISSPIGLIGLIESDRVSMVGRVPSTVIQQHINQLFYIIYTLINYIYIIYINIDQFWDVVPLVSNTPQEIEVQMVQRWTLGSNMSWLFGHQNPNMSSKFLSNISRFHCHDSSPQGVLSLIPIMTFSSRHLLSSKAQAIWRAEDEAVNEANAIIPRDPMVTMAQKKCYNKNIHTYHLRGWFIDVYSII